MLAGWFSGPSACNTYMCLGSAPVISGDTEYPQECPRACLRLVVVHRKEAGVSLQAVLMANCHRKSSWNGLYLTPTALHPGQGRPGAPASPLKRYTQFVQKPLMHSLHA